MARQVRLVDTGEMSTSDVSFRAPNKKYFSSEDAYNKWQSNNEYRNKCIDKMFEIMGYKEKMVLPTYFFKKLEELRGVGYEAVYNTMISQANVIGWALKNKNFGGETAKVMYIMAIINNNVMDEYKKIVRQKREQKTQDFQFFIDEYPIENKAQPATNISRWLEDED